MENNGSYSVSDEYLSNSSGGNLALDELHETENLKLILLSTMFSLSIVSNGCSILAIIKRNKKLRR